MEAKKTILVTNDDGIEAKGLFALIDAVESLGEIIVVAPAEPQSGMSHAITVKHPLRIKKHSIYKGIQLYSVNGTPVDCVKIAMNRIIKKRPGLIVSGVNHGSNTASSVLYSGTLGAALEGGINRVPAIGYSYDSFDHDAEIDIHTDYIRKITAKVIEHGLPDHICLNVNIPAVKTDDIKGVKICRQNIGYWVEEYDKRVDPAGKEYYWLTGKYENTEPDATDTDEWAIKNNYIAIVPLRTDLTCYKTLDTIKKWEIK